VPGPDGQRPYPARGEEPAQAGEPELACYGFLAVAPDYEVRRKEEVRDGPGGDVVPHSHPNGAGREGDDHQSGSSVLTLVSVKMGSTA